MSRKISRRDMTLLLAAFAAAGCQKRESGGGTVASADKPAEPGPAQTGVPGVTADTIKLGSYGPLSGPAAQWGVVLHAMNAYFQHINARAAFTAERSSSSIATTSTARPRRQRSCASSSKKSRCSRSSAASGLPTGAPSPTTWSRKACRFSRPPRVTSFWSEGGKKNVYTVFPKYVTEGEDPRRLPRPRTSKRRRSPCSIRTTTSASRASRA